MTILYSKRVLPSNQDSTREIQYLKIPGVIVNNELDIEGNYTAPSLDNNSTTIPNLNNDIRLLLDNASSSCDSNASVYFLPSLCCGFHNIVNNKFSIFDITETTINLFQQETDSNDTNLIVYTTTVECTDSNDSNVSSLASITLENDGLLSSCYKFCISNIYSDDYGHKFYNFTIFPFNLLTDTELFPNRTFTLNNIMATREFEIGKEETLMTDLSLLYHGKLKLNNSDDSIFLLNSEYSQFECCVPLYWVQLSLFYTDIHQKVCSGQNATTIHIRNKVGAPFELAFTPYFAKSSKTVDSIPIKYKSNEVDTQFSNHSCVNSNTSYGQVDFYNNIYVGDGTMAIQGANTEKDFIKISDSVSISDVEDTSLEIYIVLLPKSIK